MLLRAAQRSLGSGTTSAAMRSSLCSGRATRSRIYIRNPSHQSCLPIDTLTEQLLFLVDPKGRHQDDDQKWSSRVAPRTTCSVCALLVHATTRLVLTHLLTYNATTLSDQPLENCDRPAGCVSPASVI